MFNFVKGDCRKPNTPVVPLRSRSRSILRARTAPKSFQHPIDALPGIEYVMLRARDFRSPCG